MKRALAVLLAAMTASQGCAIRSVTHGEPARPGVVTSSSLASAPAGRLPLPAFGRAASGRQAQAALRSPAEWEKYLRAIPVGSKVKVTVAGMREFKATFVGFEDNHVTVRPRTRIPEPARQIPLSSLEWIELDQGGGVGKAIAISAAVGAATVLGILMMLAASMD